MSYHVLQPNIQSVGGFWSDFGSALGVSVGITSPEANVDNATSPPPNMDVPADDQSIVQQAQTSSGMGTLIGNLFGNVITGAAQYGLDQIMPDQPQYATNPDGSITPVAQQPVQDSGGSGAAIGGGVIIAVAIGVIVYLSTSK